MKTLSERNRILNEVKDTCYLAFFDGNPEEGGKEILTGRKKVNFPVATNGYVKSTNQLDFTGGEEDIIAYGETSQKTYTGKNFIDSNMPPVSSSGRTTISQVDNGIEVVRKNTSQTGAAYAIVPIQNVDRLLGQVVSYSFDVDGDRADEVMTLYGYKNGTVTNTRKMGFSNTSGSFTMPASLPADEDGYCFCLYVATGEDKKATFTNIQLELGSTVSSYEPYVGGVQSPNIDYPQEIKSVNVWGIELREVGDYKDNLFSENGKWYVHRETKRLDLKISEMDNTDNYPGWKNKLYYSEVGAYCNDDLAKVAPYYVSIGKSTGYGQMPYPVGLNTNSALIMLPRGYYKNMSQTQLKENYPNLTVTIVCGVVEHDDEITDAATISALEEMFGNATGVAKYWGIYDSEVGGKLLYYFIMPYEVNIVKGSTVTINAGNCVLKEG